MTLRILVAVALVALSESLWYDAPAWQDPSQMWNRMNENNNAWDDNTFPGNQQNDPATMGQWSAWSYSACSATCGEGTRTRSQFQTCPNQQSTTCSGVRKTTESCSNGPCSDQPWRQGEDNSPNQPWRQGEDASPERWIEPPAGGSSGGSTGSKYDAAQAKAIVDSHNKYRAVEKATKMIKLQWDTDLAASAQKAANLCKYGHTTAGGGYTWPTVLTSKFGEDIGENIYASTISAATLAADKPVDNWASEKADYDFSNNKCNAEFCGHYTQVTWDSTTHVGCGVTDCDPITGIPGWHKGTIVFCQYGPAGNMNRRVPFTKGTTCSSCPSGSSCVDSLCESAGNVVVG